MSCLVPPGGHTKMDTILTYWQQLTFQIRWEELLWRSHLSRWKWIWIQAITRNSSLRDYAIEKYRPNRSLCGCINGAYMNESALGMNSCTNRMSLTLEWMYQQCTSIVWTSQRQRPGMRELSSQIQDTTYIDLFAKMKQRWKRLQSRHASAAHTKLRHSVEGIAGLEGHRDSWDDC